MRLPCILLQGTEYRDGVPEACFSTGYITQTVEISVHEMNQVPKSHARWDGA